MDSVIFTFVIVLSVPGLKATGKPRKGSVCNRVMVPGSLDVFGVLVLCVAFVAFPYLVAGIYIYRERERETETETETERQRDRDRERQTETDRQTDRQTERREREMERGSERERERERRWWWRETDSTLC